MMLEIRNFENSKQIRVTKFKSMNYSQSLKRIKRITVLSLLLCGAPTIFMVLSIPSWWIYQELALRKAFGSQPPPGVRLERITKPYFTATFSNGKTVDVGPVPANVSNLFHLATGIPAVVLYILLITRYGPKWFRSGKWQRRGVSIAED
jgi:hypothetical protein